MGQSTSRVASGNNEAKRTALEQALLEALQKNSVVQTKDNVVVGGTHMVPSAHKQLQPLILSEIQSESVPSTISNVSLPPVVQTQPLQKVESPLSTEAMVRDMQVQLAKMWTVLYDNKMNNMEVEQPQANVEAPQQQSANEADKLAVVPASKKPPQPEKPKKRNSPEGNKQATKRPRCGKRLNKNRRFRVINHWDHNGVKISGQSSKDITKEFTLRKGGRKRFYLTASQYQLQYNGDARQLESCRRFVSERINQDFDNLRNSVGGDYSKLEYCPYCRSTEHWLNDCKDWSVYLNQRRYEYMAMWWKQEAQKREVYVDIRNTYNRELGSHTQRLLDEPFDSWKYGDNTRGRDSWHERR